MDEMKTKQEKDSIIYNAISQVFDRGFVSQGKLKGQAGLCLKEGVLFRGKQLLVSKLMREEIISCAHDATHAGRYRTYTVIKQRR